MDINLLVKITARAWCLPILAAFHQGVPGRQAALLAVTGAGRTALAQSLAHLTDCGLIERNPGHGHPLRPEFRLTDAGLIAAAAADRILKASPAIPTHPLLRRSWTVPVLASSAASVQFSQIKSRLKPITDRALSQTLKALQNQNWLRRDVRADVYPPRAAYQAIGAGARIAQAASPSYSKTEPGPCLSR